MIRLDLLKLVYKVRIEHLKRVTNDLITYGSLDLESATLTKFTAFFTITKFTTDKHIFHIISYISETSLLRSNNRCTLFYKCFFSTNFKSNLIKKYNI